MKKIFLLNLILLVLIPFGGAQNANDFAPVDIKMREIPKSKVQTSTGISDYIKANFETDSERLRAAWIWIASNIQYDVAKMNFRTQSIDPKQLVSQTLQSRKAVCIGYAQLFKDLCDQMNLKCLIVEGFTKQLGLFHDLPHAWNAVFSGGKWTLYDVTWGAGSVNSNREFVPQVNNSFFAVEPQEMIKTHAPFDPMFQFLNAPVTNQEFVSGEIQSNSTKKFYNFSDSLAVYAKQSEKERMETTLNRMKRDPVPTPAFTTRLEDYSQSVAAKSYNEKVMLFNAAGKSFDEAVNHFNQFIAYRNKQFIPFKPDSEIQLMLTRAANPLEESLQLLQQIHNVDPPLQESLQSFKAEINRLQTQVDEHQHFLNNYFATPESQRKQLFYTVKKVKN